eukprot:2633662-Prorocentrum_lima.AAC.1
MVVIVVAFGHGVIVAVVLFGGCGGYLSVCVGWLDGSDGSDSYGSGGLAGWLVAWLAGCLLA